MQDIVLTTLAPLYAYLAFRNNLFLFSHIGFLHKTAKVPFDATMGIKNPCSVSETGTQIIYHF